MIPLQSVGDQFWSLVAYFGSFVGLAVLLIVIGAFLALLLRLQD